jgi:DNA-binding NtrC family response regulator
MTRISMHIHDLANRMVARAMLEAAGCVFVEENAEVCLFDDADEALAHDGSANALILCTMDGVEKAVQTMQEGVYGYVLLPFVPGELELMVARAAGFTETVNNESRLETLAEVEQEHIKRILRECKHNQAEAARRLNIGRNTLWRKLKHKNTNPPDVKPE